ncbi:hypothetical protein EWM60_18195 [Candidatus Erwinia dacicola]|nr:hypothetical protein [Candidatus Erwinia dacicola]
MFSTGHNDKMIEILSGPERRRRRTPQEKIAIVQQTLKPGMTVSHVARLHGVNANQVFIWRRQYQNGSLTAVSAGEDVVPASELIAAMKQIKELQRLLGKKTMEVELLKEAVEYGRTKKMDSARALASRGYGLTLISRCLNVSRRSCRSVFTDRQTGRTDVVGGIMTMRCL